MAKLKTYAITSTGIVIAADAARQRIVRLKAGATTARITLADGVGNELLNIPTHTVAAAGIEYDVPEDAQWASGGAALGSNLVANGDFAVDEVWTKDTGWSIGSGVASCSGAQLGNTDLYQTVLEVGKFYKVVYTVSNYVAGNVRCRAGATDGAQRSANGTYTEYLQCTTTQFAVIRGDVDFNGDIDNVSFQEVEQQAELECTAITGSWLVHAIEV